MGLRPGRCYSSLKDRPYTRTAVRAHDLNYIGTSPAIKIRQFNMGNPLKEYAFVLDLIAEDSLQLRDNAIEAVRQNVNRYLNNVIGKENYFMKIRIYPFQVLRENKLAQGAGADRVSRGMSHCYGKPIGRAVRIRDGQVLMSLLCNAEHIEISKEALMRAKAKFPCGVRVKIHQDVKSIGTRPKQIKEIVEEVVVKEEEAAEGAPAAEGKEAGKEAAGAKKDEKGKPEDKGAGKAAGKAPGKEEKKK